MKTSLRLLFPVLLLSLLPGGAAHAGLVFEPMVVSAPCAPGQPVVTAEVPFRVEGKKPLSVTQILTSCNCTTGEADAPEYAPGARGKIKLTFTVGERVGFQRKTITVKTSDGQEQVAFFQTTVPVILDMKPAFLLWRKGEAATPKTADIQVALDQPVQIQSVTSSHPDAFSSRLVPVEPGKRYTLHITPKNTDTAVTARLVLKSDFPNDTAERFVIVSAVR